MKQPVYVGRLSQRYLDLLMDRSVIESCFIEEVLIDLWYFIGTILLDVLAIVNVVQIHSILLYHTLFHCFPVHSRISILLS